MTRASEILELCDHVNETSARRTISFRGGSRHIRYKCGPGFKRVGQSCQRIQSSQRMKTSRLLKRAWRKRRGRINHQRIASRRTYRKMRQSGYNPGGGRR